MLAFRASPVGAVKGSIMNAGVVALISIAGLGWLGSSFFEGNRQLIIHSISGLIQQYPLVFAVGLFALSVLLASQAATVVTLMPAGIALGLRPPVLIAVFPAVNGYFFLPTYATLLAAISFDQTGTTRVGRSMSITLLRSVSGRAILTQFRCEPPNPCTMTMGGTPAGPPKSTQCTGPAMSLK